MNLETTLIFTMNCGFGLKLKECQMKKLIDLDNQTFETLSIMAIKTKTNLKNYIESVLVTHAGGGFKDKKSPTKT
jgi:hypothetical protein